MAKQKCKIFIGGEGTVLYVYADFNEFLQIKKIEGVDYLEPLGDSNVGYRLFLDPRYDAREVLDEIKALDK